MSVVIPESSEFFWAQRTIGPNFTGSLVMEMVRISMVGTGSARRGEDACSLYHCHSAPSPALLPLSDLLLSLASEGEMSVQARICLK